MSCARRLIGLTKLISCLAFILLIAGASSHVSAQSDGAEGAEINWQIYLQHSSTASAIAMALSYVDQCSEPLGILEEDFQDPDSGEDLVILSFSCSGDENEEGSAFLRFFGTRQMLQEQFEENTNFGPPILKDFQFAG
ncbi:MAG: hypothetical protein AAGD23_09255 [Pseudomonadota bacterium]